MEVVSVRPVLFSEDETNYDHNGIGVLYDALRCDVYEEYNGAFDVELEYPSDGELANEIKERRLILAKPNDMDDPHAFRIYEIEKDLDSGVIFARGISVTNDLAGNLILNTSVTSSTPQQALTAIKNNLIEPTIFDFVSDIQTSASAEWTRMNPLQAIVGVEGSIVDVWGGDVKRTNNAIYVYSRRGRDNVTVIRPGKNMDGFNMTISDKSAITKVLPHYTYEPATLPEYEMVESHDGSLVKALKYTEPEEVKKEPITVNGNVVVSGNAGEYVVSRYTPVDYTSNEHIREQIKNYIQARTDEVESSTTAMDVSGFPEELRQYVIDQLNLEASAYFTDLNPGSDKPSVSIKVDMIQLSDSSDWERFKDLERIQVTDTVDVYVKKFNTDVTVIIQSIKYDSIGERVLSITAGTARSDLSQSISKRYEQQTKKLEEYVSTLENGVYNSIGRTADGQSRRFSGYTEPPLSLSTEGDLWFKEVGDGMVEIFMYTGGVWAPKVSGAEVMDRLIALGIDARDVTIVNLDASSITGGDLTVTESFRIVHNGTPVLEVDAVTGKVKITAPNLEPKVNMFSKKKYFELESEVTSAYSLTKDLGMSIDSTDSRLDDISEYRYLIELEPNTTYVFSVDEPINERLHFWNSTNTLVSPTITTTDDNKTFIFTTTNETLRLGLKLYPLSTTYPVVITNIKLEKNSTKTIFVPNSYDIKGDDAWSVEIVSSNGNIFKSGNIDTVLEARVYKGGVDITTDIAVENFKWKRVSNDPEGDTIWNDKYFGGTKTVTITTEDVYRRATFFCDVTKPTT